MELKAKKPFLIGDKIVNPGEIATEADEGRAQFMIHMDHAEDAASNIDSMSKQEEDLRKQAKELKTQADKEVVKSKIDDLNKRADEFNKQADEVHKKHVEESKKAAAEAKKSTDIKKPEQHSANKMDQHIPNKAEVKK
jgi:uncharacterized coiled-coil DUF342 family protein